MKKLLKWLHAEVRKTDDALSAHQKEWGRCLGSCIEAAEFRTRIATLKEVIRAAGGRA